MPRFAWPLLSLVAALAILDSLAGLVLDYFWGLVNR